MHAEILAIGDEIASGRLLDTGSGSLARARQTFVTKHRNPLQSLDLRKYVLEDPI